MPFEQYEGEPQPAYGPFPGSSSLRTVGAQAPSTLRTSAGVASAESSLSIMRDELLAEISDFLGMGRKVTVLDAVEQERILSILKKGLRRFYNPPAVTLPEVSAPYVHSWGFLTPTRRIIAWPSVAVGDDTIAGTYHGQESNESTIEATSAVFYESMVGKYIVVSSVLPATGFLIKSWIPPSTPDTYVSSTIIVYGRVQCAANTFAITADGDYRLPDDFGGLIGPLTFGQEEGYVPLDVVGEAVIRSRRQYNTSTGRPQCASVRPLECDGGSGQRFELSTWPTTDSVCNLFYKCTLLPNALSEKNPYPLGGAAHAQTLLASCLAQAEFERDGQKGARWMEFMDCLLSSVVADRKGSAPVEYLGYNGDWSDPPRDGRTSYRDYVRREGVRVSLNGVYY